MMMTSLSHSAISAKVTAFAAGAVIEQEGSLRLGWYVLLAGRVAVYKSGGLVAEFSRRGEVFGEVGSILRRPRSARLVATEPTEVMYFDCDLDELLAHHPKVAKAMLVSLAERLVKTTDDLWSAGAE
jgi:CRP-like cAMP-binding protein